MKPTTLAVGALLAAGLTALGLGLRSLGGPAAAAEEAGARLFPDLADDVNRVASVEVAGPAGSFRIARDDRAWGLSTKGGYPVDRALVSQLVLGIAELETIEAKTTNPERYAALGVAEPDAAGSTSKLVTLRDADGQTLAALIIGDVRSSTGMASLYVRRNGEAQSWLVKGKVDVPSDANAMLDKKILELSRDEVRAAETTHADGEAVLVSKDERADSTFVVRDVPEGRELRFESVGNGMGSALEYLNLEDVMPASDFEPPDQAPVRTSYWTWDDLRIDVAVHEKDEKVYATLRASYDENGPPVAMLPGPELPEEAVPTEGDEAPASTAPEKTPDEVRARAQELNARLEPWVFEIATYAKNNFTKRMEDMVKPVEPEVSPPADEAGADEGAAIEDLLEDPVAVPADPETDTPPQPEAGDGGAPPEAPGDGSAPPEEEVPPAPDAPPDDGGDDDGDGADDGRR